MGSEGAQFVLDLFNRRQCASEPIGEFFEVPEF
jgi:hypothetical protein